MRKRANSDIFGLSFLDVISCSFAAMLALLLLAKNGDQQAPIDPSAIIMDNSNPIQPLLDRNASLSSELAKLEIVESDLNSRVSALKSELERIRNTASETVFSAPSEIESAQPGTMQSVYSGGVPVGAENVIFIIDTSGSMQVYWGYVMQTLDNILQSHPKFEGLQILSDNGEYLIPGYGGTFIPDTVAARTRANEKLRNWQVFSNSSPSEGLELALKTYASKTESLSIYVFGDDFTGRSYDEVLSIVDRWNVDAEGNRKAAIHGIGFSWGIGDRFSTLMREVAYRNGGVFVGL